MKPFGCKIAETKRPAKYFSRRVAGIAYRLPPYLCRMEYFSSLTDLLKMEQAEDRRSYQELAQRSSLPERRASGLAWYPIAIRDTEMGRGDYLTVEVERTTHQDITHQLRFGASAALFSNHDPKTDRVEGTVSFQNGNRLKITLRTDELPEWARDGKLGIELLFDDNSYAEMFSALRQANAVAEKTAGKTEDGRLVRVLTGVQKPGFAAAGGSAEPVAGAFPGQAAGGLPGRAAGVLPLNAVQQLAVDRILAADDLAIVHGPPGTGKTTTLVRAIRALSERDRGPILVVAPSNTAVDLLSEKLSDEGLNVLRVGNPARVSERLLSLTLDSKMAEHPGMKEIKRLKKKASEFRDMAHKYKRSFGAAEREQRKALFDEARNLLKEVERTEQYILDDLTGKAQVITATLVGANHYTVRALRFQTTVIDEAGQALEPACWIPILKARRLILAGDHCQLPPTVKSEEAARGGLATAGLKSAGLATTLLEKCVALHPEAVVLLEEQYRMHATIMGYSSSVFYEGKLKAHASVAAHSLFDGDSALSFVDTAGCGYDERQEGTALSNPEEAAFLIKHATRFIEELSAHYPAAGFPATGNIPAAGTLPIAADFPTVGIVSPYRRQVDLLRELLQHSSVLKAYGDKISVNTIDSFQGQERDVIYIGLTRSNADNKIGFLADIRRMNVAMTRARKKLIVIGDSGTLARLPFYANFITYAEQREAYRSAWEFVEG
jgi:ATP-dependent RNA/DNA helicase IGHMBP2